MRKLTFCSIAILGLMGIIGCKKSNTNTPSTSMHLLSNVKVTTNGKFTDSVFFKYDNINRLTDIGSDIFKSDIKFSYNSYDKVTEIDNYNNAILFEKDIFSYSPGAITEQVTLYTQGTTNSGTANIILNSDGRIIKKDLILGPANSYYTCAYDNSGNIVTQVIYTKGVAGAPYNFTYDNHKNPFLDVKGNAYLLNYLSGSSANNKISETGTTINIINGKSTSSTYTNVYSYTYDAYGYPITMATTQLSGNVPTQISETLSYQ